MYVSMAVQIIKSLEEIHSADRSNRGFILVILVQQEPCSLDKLQDD